MSISEVAVETAVISPKPKQKATGGSWKKGQSGNPTGRPKLVGHLRDLAQEHTEEAILALAEIASDPDCQAGARVAAACALLDRGYGRPVQSVNVDTNVSVRVHHLEALQALNALVRESNAKAKPRLKQIEGEIIKEGKTRQKRKRS